MSEKVTPVYSTHNPMDDYVGIQPEYVYMTIPAEYICIYHKILIMLADFGVDLLNDCQASCTSKNKKVIDCFNMFNAAVAARQLNQHKLAFTLIEYVKGQIKINYNGNDPVPDIVYPVDEQGRIKAVVGCGNKPVFKVDPETGKLWEAYQGKLNAIYALGEEDEETETDNPSTGE